MIDRDHPPDPRVRDCLFAFEVLRRLGFKSEQIQIGFVTVPGHGPGAVAILKVGDKQWSWILGLFQATAEERAKLDAELGEATAFWNDPSKGATVPWGYMESPFNNCYLAITGHIQAKGIAVPVTDVKIPV